MDNYSNKLAEHLSIMSGLGAMKYRQRCKTLYDNIDSIIDRGVEMVEDIDPKLAKGAAIGAAGIIGIKALKDLSKNKRNKYVYNKKKNSLMRDPEAMEAVKDFVHFYPQKNN